VINTLGLLIIPALYIALPWFDFANYAEFGVLQSSERSWQVEGSWDFLEAIWILKNSGLQ
jgi:hypothetical protein